MQDSEMLKNVPLLEIYGLKFSIHIFPAVEGFLNFPESCMSLHEKLFFWKIMKGIWVILCSLKISFFEDATHRRRGL